MTEPGRPRYTFVFVATSGRRLFRPARVLRAGSEDPASILTCRV